jgi:hypothetical protein
MTLNDILLTPIYLMVIYAIMFAIRGNIKDRVLRQYFIPAFNMKIIGAIGLGMIYQFYYGQGVGGGDTFNFFYDCKPIWEAFTTSPMLAFRIIFAEIGDQSPDTFQYTQRIYFFSAGDAQTFNLIRIAGFFSLLTFHTYLPIGILFALASFTGMWAMYRAFYSMYPHLHKRLAWAIFFIPSVYFWGSGLLKDTIALGALGWTFYAFYFGLIKRRNIGINIFILLFTVFIIQSIKVYIIAAFLPPAFLWVFLQYRKGIRSAALRVISFPIVIAIAVPLGLWAINRVTADQERYQIENIAATTETTATWLQTVSEKEGGSGYTLGKFDGTLVGLIRYYPQAVWLGLFQPYLWEARNPIMLLSALEAFTFLFFTLMMIYRSGIFKIWSVLFNEPVTLFCLGFAVVMAAAVALASFNYGTMVRYRIPLQPFYLAMLFIIQFHLKKPKKLVRLARTA